MNDKVCGQLSELASYNLLKLPPVTAALNKSFSHVLLFLDLNHFYLQIP